MQKLDFSHQLNQLAVNQKQARKKVSQKIHKVVYTTILHRRREVLGLSIIEYCVADIIYSFSNAPKSKEIGGWCYASKQHIADCLGIGKKTVDRAISKLVKLALVEKDQDTKFLRTGDRWYSEVMTYKNSLKS
jgi:hypothetical protein